MAQDKAAGMITFPAPLEAAANDGKTVGGFLATTRGVAGLTLTDVSAATKVKVEHLQSIEEMRPDRLPPMPYTIGFVKAYARALGLDETEIAQRFREEAAPATAKIDDDGRVQHAPDFEDSDTGARLVSIVAIVVIGAFVLWTATQIFSGSDEAAPVSAPERRVILRDAAATPPVAAPVREAETASAISADEITDEVDAASDGERAAVSEDATPADSQPQATQGAMVATEAESEAEFSAAPAVTGDEEAATQEDAAPILAEPPAPRERRIEQPAPQPIIVAATLTRSAAPDYPEVCARTARDLETVTVRFDVSAAGRVTNARVASSSNSCFESNALAALSHWRFTARTVNGEAAAESGKSATLNFRK